jgi:DNA repair protein RadA/Sms
MKVKTTFFCQSCGAQYAKWMGQCKSCQEWNTIVEEVVQKEEKRAWKPKESKLKPVQNKPQKVSEIPLDTSVRLTTLDPELDNVLGGGVVPGSLILLGGEPGIGKSTLLLQVALSMSQTVLYVSGVT